ncbi:UDP-glucuronosyltransferase [Paucisalibacillus sp. EB02]|uniref:MGDG synthase family glycosyltransferase n=1 Tax=Paucisalibacillus sp. EB02 TaxID=1347087 RepID=UPI0004B01E13|nr:UDP-glucuronosyltransferase [Paucisalibacillus sp. EB02]
MDMIQKDEALFLPFMQIPTGHHHVADAVIEELQRSVKEMTCDKVDILSYSYGKIEKLVSTTYLHWIKVMPKAYDLLYKSLAVKNQTKRSRQLLYEAMFTSFFMRLVKENQPRIVFCTHCLPSNIASILKEKGKLQAITVNVYTDYFVNRVWGITGIDYHFVPSIRVKEFLVKLGVDKEKIFLTGIPVHSVFQKQTKQTTSKQSQVLITGGSLGVGAIEKIIPIVPEIRYKVLCGKNQKLYNRLRSLNHPLIEPIPYLTIKDDINKLYDQVDAVITKPGGVTVSECLTKRVPIFTTNALPGQEKVNELELQHLGVANTLDPLQNIEKQIIEFFQSKERQETYNQNLDTYHNQLEKKSLSDILLEICN